ncbi:A24 family peptidase [Desulfocucumis palustris]|nr:A24 family peptidase [Desulfocucumis palustris]
MYSGILPLPWSLILPLLVWTAYTDIRFRIIPNTAVLALAATGFVLQPHDAVTGFLGCFIILLPLYCLNGIGGGDVKLTAAMGALLGYRGGVEALFFTSLLAIAYIFIIKLTRGKALGWIKDSIFTTFTIRFIRVAGFKRPAGQAELIKETVPLGAFFLPGILMLFLFQGGKTC